MPARYIKGNRWAMKGTEKESVYVVLAKTKRGVIGARDLEDKRARVRIEPDKKYVSYVHSHLSNGWKKCEDGHCSIIVAKDQVEDAVIEGLRVLI